jgi:hypothetical protein
VAWAEERPQEFLFWTGPDVASTDLHKEASQNWAKWLEERIRIDASAGAAIPDDIEPAVAAQALLGMCNRVLRWWLTNGCGTNGKSVKREGVVSTLVRFHLAVYGINPD